MSTTSALMTVEQFRRLEDPPGFYLELRDGEPVPVTRPKMKHWRLQRRLSQVLDEALGDQGISGMEFPFRPTAEHNLWAADVAWVSNERYQRIEEDDNLCGSPEIVVEVLSPSNTESQMEQRKRICLENGCHQFWVVDQKNRTIEVTRRDGTPTLHIVGDALQIGSRTYTLDEVFR